jgi:short-subunit dehydrogenase involved in D-alanine esterification of teichoic acids
MKLLLFDVVCFYLLIAFVIFYVKSDKSNTIEIMIENAQAKNRKQLSDTRDLVKNEVKISLLWPILLGKHLINEIKRYRN